MEEILNKISFLEKEINELKKLLINQENEKKEMKEKKENEELLEKFLNESTNKTSITYSVEDLVDDNSIEIKELLDVPVIESIREEEKKPFKYLLESNNGYGGGMRLQVVCEKCGFGVRGAPGCCRYEGY